MSSPSDMTGGYQIERLLGEGGSGKVYLAQKQGESFALKFLELPLNSQSLRFFKQEASLLSHLSHPHLVKIFDFFEMGRGEEPKPFFVMEYLSGVPLDELPANSPFHFWLKIFVQTCQGLHYLHSRNVLHHDLKPSNIYWTENQEVKLLDFSLSVPWEDARSISPLRGTLPFLPPESYLGSFDNRSDLFSLGVVFYWLLTRTFPYKEALNPEAMTHISPPPPLQEKRPDLPGYFCDLIHWLLTLPPTERPPSVLTVLRYLEQHTGQYFQIDEEGWEQTFEKIPFFGREHERAAVHQILDSQDPSFKLILLTAPTGAGRSRFLEELRWKYLLASRKITAVSPENASSWKNEIHQKIAPEKTPPLDDFFSFSKLLKAEIFHKAPILIFQDLHRWPSNILQDLEVFLKVLKVHETPVKIILEWNEDLTGEKDPFHASEDLFLHAIRIRLEDFSEDQTIDLIRTALGETPLSSPQIHQIARSSGGRVLLALELLQEALVQTKKSSGAKKSLSLARNFQEALQQKIEGLSKEAQVLLSLLVTHSEPVEDALLKRLWLIPGKGFEEAVLELEQKGLVSQRRSGDSSYGLKHPSLQSTMETELSPELRNASQVAWVRVLNQEFSDGQNPDHTLLLLMDHALAAGRHDLLREYGLQWLTLLDQQSLFKKALRSSVELLKSSSDPVFQSKVFAQQAPLFYKMGLYEESLKAYRQWFERRGDDETRLQRVKFFYYAGLVCSAAKRAREAVQNLEECLRTGDSQAHSVLRPYHLRAFILLAAERQGEGNMGETRTLLNRALKLEVKDPTLVGETEQRLGELERSELHFEMAEDHLQKCLHEYQKTKSPQEIAIAFNALAILAQEQGFLEMALKKSSDAVEKAQEGGQRVQWARYEGNRGLFLTERGKWKEGLEALGRSREILQVLGNNQEKFVVDLQLAQAYLHLGLFDRTGELLNALKKEKAILVTFNLWVPFLVLRADAALMTGDLDTAHSLFQHVLDSHRSLPANLLLSVHLGLFKALFLKNKKSENVELLKDLLAPLKPPLFRMWKELIDWCTRPPSSFDSTRWHRFSQGLSELENPETRLEFFLFLEIYFQRNQLKNLAAQMRNEREKEWQMIFHSLPEEFKMDYEKNRSLSDVDQALEKAIESKKPSNTPRPSPSSSLPPERPKIPEERFRQFCEITNQLAQKNDLEEILERIMDAAIILTGAERGFLILKNEKKKEGSFPGFEVKVARHINQQAFDEDEFQFSHSVVKKAITQGGPVFTGDALSEKGFQEMKSIHLYQLKSILVVPLEIGGQVIGALYLDHRYQLNCFKQEDIVILSGFASQAGLAIQRVQMMEALQKANLNLQTQVKDQAQKLEVLSEELTQAKRNLKYEYQEIVGSSPPMMKVFQLLDHVTQTKIPVWIWGESGTGKELIARSLHYNSPRKEGPFVSENCSSIPENLLESELFGHKKGAFTHADRDRVGLFEQADGGTLFLDEVADMPMAMQVKLLRVLQEGEIRPLGSNKKIKVDVRLVTASNKNLAQLVKEGKFREDLFYRINGLTLPLPPLRERKEDIPLLVHHMMEKIAKDFGLKPCKVSKEALHYLMKQNWPGNIRQLEGFVRNAMMFADGKALSKELFEMHHLSASSSPLETVTMSTTHFGAKDESQEERKQLVDSLRRHHLDKKKVADELGITLKSVYVRMEKFGIPKKNSLLMKFLSESPAE